MSNREDNPIDKKLLLLGGGAAIIAGYFLLKGKKKDDLPPPSAYKPCATDPQTGKLVDVAQWVRGDCYQPCGIDLQTGNCVLETIQDHSRPNTQFVIADKHQIQLAPQIDWANLERYYKARKPQAKSMTGKALKERIDSGDVTVFDLPYLLEEANKKPSNPTRPPNLPIDDASLGRMRIILDDWKSFHYFGTLFSLSMFMMSLRENEPIQLFGGKIMQWFCYHRWRIGDKLQNLIVDAGVSKSCTFDDKIWPNWKSYPPQIPTDEKVIDFEDENYDSDPYNMEVWGQDENHESKDWSQGKFYIGSKYWPPISDWGLNQVKLPYHEASYWRGDYPDYGGVYDGYSTSAIKRNYWWNNTADNPAMPGPQGYWNDRIKQGWGGKLPSETDPYMVSVPNACWEQDKKSKSQVRARFKEELSQDPFFFGLKFGDDEDHPWGYGPCGALVEYASARYAQLFFISSLDPALGAQVMGSIMEVVNSAVALIGAAVGAAVGMSAAGPAGWIGAVITLISASIKAIFNAAAAIGETRNIRENISGNFDKLLFEIGSRYNLDAPSFQRPTQGKAGGIKSFSGYRLNLLLDWEKAPGEHPIALGDITDPLWKYFCVVTEVGWDDQPQLPFFYLNIDFWFPSTRTVPGNNIMTLQPKYGADGSPDWGGFTEVDIPGYANYVRQKVISKIPGQ